MYRHLLSSLLAVTSKGDCGEVWQQCHSCQLSFNTLKFLFILVTASKLLKYLSNCSLYIYYKKPVATDCNRFLLVFEYSKKKATSNQQPATATGFESGQPQPMVQLQLVAFRLVSVIFLVLATGPLNTRLVRLLPFVYFVSMCAVHCGSSRINCGFDPDMYCSILNMTSPSHAQSLCTFRQTHIY